MIEVMFEVMRYFGLNHRPSSDHYSATVSHTANNSLLFGYYCSGCQRVTRELVTLAYFSVCLHADHLSLESSSEESACVGYRLTPPTLSYVTLSRNKG